jgi:hypothetical protein
MEKEHFILLMLHPGPPNSNPLDGIKLSNTGKLCSVAMNDIIPAPSMAGTTMPFSGTIAADWFTQSIDACPSAMKAHATAITFTLTSFTLQHPVHAE